MAPSTTQMVLHGTVFTADLNPPGRSSKTLFLGGAGVRGLHINGKFKVFTLSGVYLEPEAINFLAQKWRGKTLEELSTSNQFFQDIITCPFDKLSQITLVAHLGGKEFAEKVAQSCIAYLKKKCLYSEKEDEKAAEEFRKLFAPVDLPPGSTVFFTYSASNHLLVSISKDTSVPEVENGVVGSSNFSEALLGSIIGEDGVSPAAKLSLATRLHDIINTA